YALSALIRGDAVLRVRQVAIDVGAKLPIRRVVHHRVMRPGAAGGRTVVVDVRIDFIAAESEVDAVALLIGAKVGIRTRAEDVVSVAAGVIVPASRPEFDCAGISGLYI